MLKRVPKLREPGSALIALDEAEYDAINKIIILGKTEVTPVTLAVAITKVRSTFARMELSYNFKEAMFV